MNHQNEMRYGIWFALPKPSRDEFISIIEKYSQNLGTETFCPHISITGPFNDPLKKVQKKVSTFVKNRKPIEVELGRVELNVRYHQCVYCRVLPNLELLTWYKDICVLFGTEPAFYNPHISLVYGNLDLAVRQMITQEIRIETKKLTLSTVEITPDLPEARDWIPVAHYDLRG